ncbi:AAA family ATPase [Methylobacterium sp. WCS2018Hpa-22]|uniref:ATP-dependent nuclease n=1 Tax=Methylobacterium sp. WCS2018Hpa-22 TaxID=3073633 RepID=UPI002889067D|nr:AAA family ATPase [Methylobacterium sp. WCS2018Hpa-22]
MIVRATLKSGPSKSQPNLSIDITPITVFIGPNNSGKSQILNEISQECRSGERWGNRHLLNSLEFSNLGESEAERYSKSIILEGSHYNTGSKDIVYASGSTETKKVNKHSLLRSLIYPNEIEVRKHFIEFYLAKRVMFLNGEDRVKLTDQQPGGELQHPRTSFQHLFVNDELRRKYSNIIYRSFGRYAVIDPMSPLGSLTLRLSKVAPPSPEVERGLGNASVAFYGAAEYVSQASDGIKAFAGIMSEVLAGDPKILLIDEPEAFLHPALAYNLGREISQSVTEVDKRLFVSTHSSQFLMGCIQSGVPINVVRLTYRDGVATARLLPNEEIVRLMRHPLLRSANVLSALFYESVVVTESDTDRAFYQEINERLLQTNRGINNCLFLNAQNKHTIPFIATPLRSLGIPTAAVYDVDFIDDGGKEAARYMEAAGIPELLRQGYNTNRSQISSALRQANPSFKTEGGINVLEGSVKTAARNYFDIMDSYGCFVVREGEVESWLKELNIKGHGSPWLLGVFGKMGEDPGSEDYINAASDDVWKFVDEIAEWLLNPHRNGMPD